MYKNKNYLKNYQLEHRAEIKKRSAEYYLKNKEMISKRRKEYRLKHLDEMKLRSSRSYFKNKPHLKKYLIKNKKILRKKAKAYYLKNKLQILKTRKEYYLKNVVNKRKYNKQYNLTHRKQINKKHGEYTHNRSKNDVAFRIRRNLKTRLYIALKGQTKSANTMQLVGCSLKSLRSYLEKMFTKGMNWKNYGKWHIDHIRPCFSFDLSKTKEQYKCFNYKNLQPLWAKDNLRKRKMDNKWRYK